jgi:EAL domain-containing protein (putative c-di-GMP-specific phosphodiesterase class I)
VTVAEGVESEAQCRELRQLGSDWAQGYLWSKPVPASELQAWLDSTARSLVEGRQDPA